MLGTDAAGRTQRQTMALKDVHYRIHAAIKPRRNFEHAISSFEAQAERRFSTGKCYAQPYLGCREFVAYFEPATSIAAPLQLTEDIGWMVYDVFDLDSTEIDHAPPFISVFRAQLKDGTLHVPPWESDLVRKPGRR